MDSGRGGDVGQKTYAVVRSHRRSVAVQGVGKSDSIGLGHAVDELLGREPLHLEGLWRRSCSPADHPAPVHEGDDPAADVLVDPRQGNRLDIQAVSSSTSRTRPAWIDASNSSTPPGGTHAPLSARQMTR
jgi:hypothetical protein